MSNTIITENLLQRETIRLLDKNSVIMPMANRKYEKSGLDGLLSQGTTVTVQTFPNVTGKFNGTAGAAITNEDFAITSGNLTINKVYQIRTTVPDIEAVQSNLDLRSQLANRYAFALAQVYDKFVASLAVDNANSSNVVDKSSPYSLASSTIYGKVEELRQKLSLQNAFGNAALFVGPKEASNIRQTALFDGFSEGLRYRISQGIASMNGLMGQMAGFDIYETNNLPIRQKVTQATQSSNTETLTFTDGTDTLTFTLVSTIGTTAGNVLLGANAAAQQTNLKTLFDAIGTTTATGVALSAADQEIFKKWQLRISAWDTNVAYFSANTALTVGGTSSADYVMGTQARVMFAMDREAVNMVEQLAKTKITDGDDGFYSNVLLEAVYGGAVIGENAKRIATLDVANT